jgi:hypothetical protein
MPYTVEDDPLPGVVRVAFAGVTNGTDGSAAELEAFIYELYDLPKQYAEEELNRRSRVAVILPASEKAREALRFYETASRNCGWDVQTFSERQGAIDWLTGDIASDKSDSGDG